MPDEGWAAATPQAPTARRTARNDARRMAPPERTVRIMSPFRAAYTPAVVIVHARAGDDCSRSRPLRGLRPEAGQKRDVAAALDRMHLFDTESEKRLRKNSNYDARGRSEGGPMNFLLRLLINAAALWVAIKIVPGVTYQGEWPGLFGVALVFGVVNAFIGPVIKILSLPVTFLTLGLFALVINGFLLWITSKLSTALGLQFQVQGCWTAILGALVVSIVSALLSMFLKDA